VDLNAREAACYPQAREEDQRARGLRMLRAREARRRARKQSTGPKSEPTPSETTPFDSRSLGRVTSNDRTDRRASPSRGTVTGERPAASATGRQNAPVCPRGRQRQTLAVRATAADLRDWTGQVEEMTNDWRPARHTGERVKAPHAFERVTWSRVNEKRRTTRRNADRRQDEASITSSDRTR
jgi:hypothetical protein